MLYKQACQWLSISFNSVKWISWLRTHRRRRWRGSPEIFSGAWPRLSRSSLPAMWSRCRRSRRKVRQRDTCCAVPVADAKSPRRKTAFSTAAIWRWRKSWRWCIFGGGDKCRPDHDPCRSVVSNSGTSTSVTYVHGSYCVRQHHLEAKEKSSRSTNPWWWRPSTTADVSYVNDSDGCSASMILNRNWATSSLLTSEMLQHFYPSFRRWWRLAPLCGQTSGPHIISCHRWGSRTRQWTTVNTSSIQQPGHARTTSKHIGAQWNAASSQCAEQPTRCFPRISMSTRVDESGTIGSG